MAQRRMFSQEIVCSEEFCDMPATSRELYFQLAIRADDDGFIQPKSIMKMLGASKNDLDVLMTLRFILPFESGVIVIKHWLIHNMIRSDRYKPTRFQEEKKRLYLKENKAYTDNPDNGKPLLATSWQPNDNQPAPQVRLGKVRLGKVKKEIPAQSADVPVVIDMFKEVNPSYKRLFGMPPQRAAADRLIKEHGIEKLRSMIGFLPKSNAVKYAPTITTPCQFEARLGELVAWSQKQKSENNVKNQKVIW